jgi:predicted dehydrogenase
VIGVGWAGHQHADAYAKLPGVELAGIAGLEEPARTALAERHGVDRHVDHWEELLDDGSLDVVSIAVPTFLHAPIAVAALERGLHVLSEKPMALSG